MAIEFTNKPTKWENEGAEPSAELKKNGFQAGYKPPAGIFNHHWHETAECIDELQTKLSDTDDKKVDKVDGKSLIDETAAAMLSGTENSTGTTNLAIDAMYMRIKQEGYETSEVWVQCNDLPEITISDSRGNYGKFFSTDVQVQLCQDNKYVYHNLSKKANLSDVLTKANTTEFTPAGDYNPATKKYVDDKVGSITVPIVDNIESDSATSALSAKQGKALNTALAAKVDKAEGKGLSTNDYTDDDKAEVAKVKDKVDKADVLTKTNTTAFTPTGNYHPATKKYVDDKVNTKVDKVSGKGLSTNDFTSAYKTKLDNLDTNLNNKVDKVSGKGLSTNDFTNAYKSILDTINSKIDIETGDYTGTGTSDKSLSGGCYDKIIKFKKGKPIFVVILRRCSVAQVSAESCEPRFFGIHGISSVVLNSDGSSSLNYTVSCNWFDDSLELYTYAASDTFKRLMNINGEKYYYFAIVERNS